MEKQTSQPQNLEIHLKDHFIGTCIICKFSEKKTLKNRKKDVQGL